MMLDSPDLYSIGWIAALPIERAAATALLDQRHEHPTGFEQRQSDTNSYTWGRIGEHNIVIASLPVGIPGATSAAVTVSNLLSSLPHIRIGLLVGIGAGVARPDEDRDIRLGDVVVSQPTETHGGVVQYDFGKVELNGRWERRGSLNIPPLVLLNALGALQTEHEMAQSQVPSLLKDMWAANPLMKEKPRNAAFVHQGVDNDRLFRSTYSHAGGKTCVTCDQPQVLERELRDTTYPEIHYGIIASGNSVIADAKLRDTIADDIGSECLCIEMEAAGLMNHFPCLVIRGICDYADSHKNDQWQRYASATAAAYAKELLSHVPVRGLQATQPATEALKSIAQDVKNIESTTANINSGVQAVRTVIDDANHKTVLAYLENHVAKGASFNSLDDQHEPFCLENTRVDLFKQISEWTRDPTAHSVFWLNGMAGTGKSTISRSLARTLAMDGRLGGSFFFKRGELDRSSVFKFFSTIAADLAISIPAMARHIKQSIDNDPAIFRKVMAEQFNKLIWHPVSVTFQDAPITDPFVIVVDALDECEREDDVNLMIELFSRVKTLAGTSKLKFFLTSRPELPIRLGFHAIQGAFSDLILHEIPKPVIENDITVFLTHGLTKIREQFNVSVSQDRQLPTDWPGQINIKSLAQIASPLFIFAATMCRFVADDQVRSPDTQLSEILVEGTKSQGSQLDKTYLPVLKKLISGITERKRKHILGEFRVIVGSIILLASPLTTYALSKILNIDKRAIDSRLDLLHSVLDVPSSAATPVRLFHLSFREFLLDPSKKERPFWIDEQATHASMAANCLRVLGCLRQDICELKNPGIERSDINLERINDSLPSEVQYSCIHWVHHLRYSGDQAGDSEHVYTFLKTHFLHWIESLSLLGRAYETADLVRELQSLYQHGGDGQLSEFLEDALRFILASTSIIDSAPLQIYSSLLVFSPTKCKIRTAFQHEMPRWVSLQPKMDDNWSQCLLRLESDAHFVPASIAFSHDSALIVCGSYDHAVRIWRVATGEHLQTCEGHGGWVSSVSFSYNSTLIASASDDHSVRIWRTATGECVHTLRGHEGSVMSVAFPRDDSALLASSSSDRTVRIWDSATGECILKLEGHEKQVLALAFSHDSALVASGSVDGTVRIWRALTGVCVQTLACGARVSSVAFSHDSKLIAAASKHSIFLFCVNTTDEWEKDKALDCGREVSSVACSSDSDLFLSSSPELVRIWRASTGECVQTLACPGSMMAIFSHDARLIAVACTSGAAEIWRAAGPSSSLQTLERHEYSVKSVSISPDFTVVASTSPDSVRLWHAGTGECIKTLRRPSFPNWGWILRVVFSHNRRHLAAIFSSPRDSCPSWIRIWDVTTGETITTIQARWECRVVAFSPDSDRLAAGFNDYASNDNPDNTSHPVPEDYTCVVRIWHVATGECLKTIPVQVRGKPLALSLDLSLLAVRFFRKMRICHASTGECLQTLAVNGAVTSAFFSHESELLASEVEPDDPEGFRRVIRIWRLATGECVKAFEPGFVLDVPSFRKLTDRHRTTSPDLQPVSAGGSVDSYTSAFGICLKECWVTWYGKRLLWLPPDYRPESVARVASTFYIGGQTGRVIMIGFSHEEASKAFAIS